MTNLRIVIPSARAANLIQCVWSIIQKDGHIQPIDIIVVDDGARTPESEPELPRVQWVDGWKPFVFARNVNLGIAAAGDADVIVMNDDTQLVTPDGFSEWHRLMQTRPDTICSAGIIGTVYNLRQQAQSTATFRPEAKHLAFVCVYFPRTVLDTLGPLDERFTGYGYEDFDYCERARRAGLKLATWDGCVVDHSGYSTYRNNPEWPSMMMDAQRIYRDKWA